jgi:hypothetical protein
MQQRQLVPARTADCRRPRERHPALGGLGEVRCDTAPWRARVTVSIRGRRRAGAPGPRRPAHAAEPQVGTAVPR